MIGIEKHKPDAVGVVFIAAFALLTERAAVVLRGNDPSQANVTSKVRREAHYAIMVEALALAP